MPRILAIRGNFAKFVPTSYVDNTRVLYVLTPGCCRLQHEGVVDAYTRVLLTKDTGNLSGNRVCVMYD